MRAKWHAAKIIGIFGTLGLVALALVVLKFIFFPSGPDIVCHKMLDGAFQQWVIDNKRNAYPNVEGNSLKSLKMIEPYFGYDLEIAMHDYTYIPGLQQGDPGGMVLMYVRRKTRQTWHGHHPTIFGKSNWLIIGSDFDSPETGANNYSLNDSEHQLSGTEDLRRRVTLTLDYLKTNNRPNWKAIVAEQTKFLESVHD